MIERDFVTQKTKEYYIKSYIESKLRGAEISEIKLKKIPLGEKIIIKTSRPSLIVGSKGANIRKLTSYLKSHFKLENPQIEIKEVKNIFLDANVIASRIVSSLERFGSARFKGIGHKTMGNVLSAGALGVEIKISGKIPGARAKNWRFYQGYLKKCGDVSMNGVKTAYASALLKTGIIGIQVRIMPPDLILPDSVEILDEPVQIIESTDLEEDKTEEKKKVSKKKATKKKTPAKKKETKKKVVKIEEKVEKKSTEDITESELVKEENSVEKKEEKLAEPEIPSEVPAEEAVPEEKSEENPNQESTEEKIE
ncbi:MAG: 30S ribosomal protein S3 [archaeon]